MKNGNAFLSAMLVTAMGTTAFAQPRLVITPAAEDLDASGNKSVGRLVEWTAGPTAHYVPYLWERGVGFTRMPGMYATPEMVRGSSDLTNLVSNLRNDENWGDLNCFNGYCFANLPGCTPGEPRPPENPCWVPTNAFWYSSSTGWINTGSFDRLQDPGTGRWYGGTRCDGTIASPYDISGDGRYIVGGAWWAPLLHSSGGPGFGLCGNFYAFRYDSQTGQFLGLTSSSGSTTTRADRVNHDGSVITGYDLGPIPDGQGGFWSGRRLCVWTNGVQTLLDPYWSNSTIWPVNGPGTVIAGQPSTQFNQAIFGSGGIKLVRWVRQPDHSWQPQNLGRPVDRDQGLAIDILVALYPSAISDDGNTIIGTAQYNALGPTGTSRPFIWRPTLNNGVPLDLADYIASIDPTNPMLAEGFHLMHTRGISADGNRMLVTIMDRRNTCTNGAESHVTFTSGILYLDGTGVACDAPRIGTAQPFWEVSTFYPFGAALNVSASGSFPLSYQWQREDPNNPGQWIDLVDECTNFPLWGGDYTGFSQTFAYEGTRTNQLRIGMYEPTFCDRTGRYRVVVTNACGSVTSEPGMVTTNPAPIFVSHPGTSSFCATGGGSLAASVSGSGTYAYRWQFESPEGSDQWEDVVGPTIWDPFSNMFCDVSGETTSTLSISNVFLGSHSGTIRFRLRASAYACAGSAVSNPGALVLCQADFNCSGGVPDDADVAAFFEAWNAGDPSADVNGSGGVPDDADVALYFDLWNSGC